MKALGGGGPDPRPIWRELKGPRGKQFPRPSFFPGNRRGADRLPAFFVPKTIFEEEDEIRQTSAAKKSTRGFYGEYGGGFVPGSIEILLDELKRF